MKQELNTTSWILLSTTATILVMVENCSIAATITLTYAFACIIISKD